MDFFRLFVQLKLLTALLQTHNEAFQPSRMESKKLADQFLPGWLKEQPHISTAFHSAVIRFSKARLSSKIWAKLCFQWIFVLFLHGFAWFFYVLLATDIFGKSDMLIAGARQCGRLDMRWHGHGLFCESIRRVLKLARRCHSQDKPEGNNELRAKHTDTYIISYFDIFYLMMSSGTIKQ